VNRTASNIPFGVRDCHFSRFEGVFEVVVRADHAHLNPPIGLDLPDQFPAVHRRIAAHCPAQVKPPVETTP